MSGPKSADYYLTDAQRRKLAEQRRVNELKNKIEKLSSNYIYSQSVIDEYSSHAKELRCLSLTDNGYSELLEQFNSIDDKLKKSLAITSNLNDSASLIKSYESIKSLNKKKKSIIIHMKAIDSKNISMLKKKLDDAMGTDFNNIKSKKQVKLDELCHHIKERLSETKKNPNLSNELIAEIDSVYNRLDEFKDIILLRNYSSITVDTLLKRCQEYIELFAEYEELYLTYEALCETENMPVKQFMCCNEAIEQLRNLINEMHLSSVKADEQEYISQSIDEVMVEMGYKLIGNRSVTKKSGRKFHSELYTFNEGTAVNITHSSNGQITMELAGIDSTDRQPTDDESNALCVEMENFCDAFSEFEKRLADKGILSKHISILPPTAEYAQIINVNDYEIGDNADYSEIRTHKEMELKQSKRME